MLANRIKKNTQLVKKIAADLGFSFCGVSKAGFLEEEAKPFAEWLSKNHQGTMSYLENNFDKRLDPTLLVPNAKTVVTFLYNYYPHHVQIKEGVPKIAKYAYGQDYHFIIKKKLKTLFEHIQKEIGMVEGRVFVDSAPVHERAWAKKSGLGWIGKHSLLLNKKTGSFFFIATMISDLDLVADETISKDYCGTCTACLDACPTDAIVQPKVVDGSRCISYLTIELKEEIPKEFSDKTEGWTFGCDICQDVCPWNRFSKPNNEPLFAPQGWEDFTSAQWKEMTKEVFDKVFKKSPVKRTKYEGMMRNIKFVQSEIE